MSIRLIVKELNRVSLFGNYFLFQCLRIRANFRKRWSKAPYADSSSEFITCSMQLTVMSTSI